MSAPIYSLTFRNGGGEPYVIDVPAHSTTEAEETITMRGDIPRAAWAFMTRPDETFREYQTGLSRN